MKMLTMKISEAKATEKGEIVCGHFVNISFSHPSKGFFLFDGKIIATSKMEKDPTPEMINKAKLLIENSDYTLSISFWG